MGVLTDKLDFLTQGGGTRARRRAARSNDKSLLDSRNKVGNKWSGWQRETNEIRSLAGTARTTSDPMQRVAIANRVGDLAKQAKIAKMLRENEISARYPGHGSGIPHDAKEPLRSSGRASLSVLGANFPQTPRPPVTIPRGRFRNSKPSDRGHIIHHRGFKEFSRFAGPDPTRKYPKAKPMSDIKALTEVFRDLGSNYDERWEPIRRFARRRGKQEFTGGENRGRWPSE